MPSIYRMTLVCLLAVMSQLTAAQIKILYGPYLQNVKDTEVTLVWESDKPSVGWVEIAPNDDSHFYGDERPKYFDTTNGVKKTATLHTVKVKGLKPATTYR